MESFTRGKISRRDFLLVSGAGFCVLAANSVQPPAFMSIGLCDGGSNTEGYVTHGYSFIEPTVRWFLVPDSPEEDFLSNLKAMREGGMATPVANLFLPSKHKVVGPDIDQEAVLGYATTVFQRAQAAGIEHIVFGSSGARQIPEGFPRGVGKAQFVEVLSNMAPVAQQYGVTICIEPLRNQETNFLNTVPEVMEVLEAVSHPSAQLTFDIYHVMQGGRGADDVLLAGDAIKHCHIAENQGRRAPGVHGEDFTPFFRALKAIGYRGRISVECRWEDREMELPIAARTIAEQMARV